jgi:hypothetical protein
MVTHFYARSIAKTSVVTALAVCILSGKSLNFCIENASLALSSLNWVEITQLQYSAFSVFWLSLFQLKTLLEEKTVIVV